MVRISGFQPEDWGSMPHASALHRLPFGDVAQWQCNTLITCIRQLISA